LPLELIKFFILFISHEFSITFDADFYDISVINGHPPKIIWIRSGNLTTKEIVSLLNHHKTIIEKFLINDDYRNVSCLEIE
jgi:predicted nuclease of predicted toxin-antitoxin system